MDIKSIIDNFNIKDILLGVLPLLSAWITYIFTIKAKKDENILKFKEEKYVNLLIHLQGFVGGTTSGQTKKKFFEEQYKSWLYASDGVTIAINNMRNLLIDEKGKAPNSQKGKEIVGNIVLEMRKDLLRKTKLKNTDFQYTDVHE